MNTYLSLESTSVHMWALPMEHRYLAVLTWFLPYSCIQCTHVYEW